MAIDLAAGTLASRGARNPDAFAAFIASRARNGSRTIGLASQEGGPSGPKTCPNCGYDLSDDGDNDDTGSATLRTPAPSTGYVRQGAPLTVRSSSAGLANEMGLSVELTAPRYPVTSPQDVLITNRPEGGATVRHRRGGGHIGDITYSEQDGWQAVYGGRAGRGHVQQRPALAELIRTWNTGTTNLERPGMPLAHPPAQTPLMEQYGITNIRALATPSAGVSDGPRMTSSASSDSDDDDSSGMSPRAAGVYKKLLAKGWDKAKAKRFAANADRFGSK